MDAIMHALGMAFAMGWQILWPLILGFTLSGIVQAVVSHSEMRRLLPDDRPRSIAIALGLGAASSSCSYVAVALARSGGSWPFRPDGRPRRDGHGRYRRRLALAADNVG